MLGLGRLFVLDLLFRFPLFKVVSPSMIVNNVLIRIIERDIGSIGFSELDQTRAVKELLSTPVAIAFGLQDGIFRNGL